jgi:thiol-disulfide isomerase/thioredoxin
MSLSTLIRWSAIATLAVGIGIVVGKTIPQKSPASLSSRPASSTQTQSPAPGKPVVLKFVKDPESAPSFHVVSFSGQPLDPSEWKGKVVILNFWATWCTPCRYEIPELMQLQKQFRGSLQIVGLSVDDSPAAQVKQFVQQIGFTYPVAMASEKLQDEYGGILALPTSFVLNRQGQVVQKHVGLVPADYYAAVISYLAGKQVNAKVETFVDDGQVFPANVKNAKSLPGVDMSHLTAAQRKAALTQMNQMRCTCGCDYTVAQCRLLDSSCPTSKAEARKVVQQVSGRTKPAAPPKAAAL